MDSPRIVILRGRETDPAINKYCRALTNQKYRIKLLIWNRRGSSINQNHQEFPITQFFFHAPLDKFSAVFFYPIWWMYITYFLLKEKPDIIHACDFDTLIPVLFLKGFRKFKFVYTIFDFYAHNIQEGNFLSMRKILKKIVKSIEFYGIKCSDLLILVDESRFEEIRGATVKDLIYIYNTPEDQEVVVKKIHEPNKKVEIFFAGLLLHFRGITDMIVAVSDLSDVQLTLAGALIDAKILDEIDPQSDHIKYIGWIPSYQEVLERTMSSDILFRFSDPRHPKTRYESPNKLFEAMMCAKPIIVSDKSAMATIVRQNVCGLVVPYGDIDAIKEAIVKLRDDSYFRHELGTNGRKSYEQKYSWKIMEKRLATAYDKLIKSHAG